MGQDEIYQFLKKNPKKWFTTKEISEILGVSRGSVQCSMNKVWCSEDHIIKTQVTNNTYRFYRYCYDPKRTQRG